MMKNGLKENLQKGIFNNEMIKMVMVMVIYINCVFFGTFNGRIAYDVRM